MQKRESGSLRATCGAAREIREIWNLFERGVTGGGLVGRQWAWQYPEEKAMVFVTQLIVGLWWRSQGLPMIKFQLASLVTWKVNSFMC